MERGKVIGLVTVILSAAALAWMFDRKTEEECESQESLRKRNDWLRENYGATRQEHAHDPALKRTLAQNLARNRADACQEFLDRLKRPQQEFEAMDDDLQQSLKDTSTSPYRRNALRLIQARLTDALTPLR